MLPIWAALHPIWATLHPIWATLHPIWATLYPISATRTPRATLHTKRYAAPSELICTLLNYAASYHWATLHPKRATGTQHSKNLIVMKQRIQIHNPGNTERGLWYSMTKIMLIEEQWVGSGGKINKYGTARNDKCDHKPWTQRMACTTFDNKVKIYSSIKVQLFIHETSSKLPRWKNKRQRK